MRRSLGVVLIAGIGAVALAGVAALYQQNATLYVSTSYAYVDAPTAWVRAGAVEQLTSVAVRIGESVTAGETLATVRTPGGHAIRLSAPFAGKVAMVPYGAGAEVPIGSPLIALVASRESWVQAEVPESEARRVRVGQRVDVTFAALPDRTVTGRVTRVVPATLSALQPSVAVGGFTPETEWVSVLVRVPTAGLGLIAGESATVRIHVSG